MSVCIMKKTGKGLRFAVAFRGSRLFQSLLWKQAVTDIKTGVRLSEWANDVGSTYVYRRMDIRAQKLGSQSSVPAMTVRIYSHREVGLTTKHSSHNSPEGITSLPCYLILIILVPKEPKAYIKGKYWMKLTVSPFLPILSTHSFTSFEALLITSVLPN